MRISTSQIFNTGSRYLMDGQARLFRLQNQLSTGRKFLSAEDDPVAAAQSLLTSQSLGVNQQYADNQANAASQLALEEDRVSAMVESIQYSIEQVTAGANSTLSDSQREFFAQTLQSQLDFLMGMGNSADANGYYLFSGYQGNTKPFQQMSDGTVAYAGDDGQRLLQVGSQRQIAVSDSGRDLFQRIRTGNGVFALNAAPANTGTGVAGGSSVNDLGQWSGHGYEIQFDSPPSSFTITDTTTAASLGSFPYTPDAEITDIPGISFKIGGAPQAGDTFTVAPSTEQSVFTTLKNLIDAFSTDVDGDPVAAASLRNVINSEMQNLGRTLENFSTVQASIGSRRKELSALADVSSALDLQYQSRLSQLRDIDYAEVISAFIQQQTQLQAAQASFAQMTSLSLFQYI
jgi:flagellar hook-associated protein 3 FlgL